MKLKISTESKIAVKDIPSGHLFKDIDGAISLRTDSGAVFLGSDVEVAASHHKLSEDIYTTYPPYTDLGPLELEFD
jgi:hypothetical protein